MEKEKLNELIQATGALSEWLYILYTNLTNAGFSDMQAMSLIEIAMRTMISNNGNENN